MQKILRVLLYEYFSRQVLAPTLERCVCVLYTPLLQPVSECCFVLEKVYSGFFVFYDSCLFLLESEQMRLESMNQKTSCKP